MAQFMGVSKPAQEPVKTKSQKLASSDNIASAVSSLMSLRLGGGAGQNKNDGSVDPKLIADMMLSSLKGATSKNSENDNNSKKQDSFSNFFNQFKAPSSQSSQSSRPVVDPPPFDTQALNSFISTIYKNQPEKRQEKMKDTVGALFGGSGPENGNLK